MCCPTNLVPPRTSIISFLRELFWSALTSDSRSKEEGFLATEVIGDKGRVRGDIHEDEASIDRRKHNAICDVLRVWSLEAGRHVGTMR